MIELRNYLRKQMYRKEICQSKKNGCTLHAPGPSFGYPPEDQKVDDLSLELPDILKQFYSQVADIELRYEISENTSAGRPDTSIQFKEDAWLKENYFDEDYSWEAVKILLSGHMQIASLDDMLDIEKVKACGLYEIAVQMGLETGSLRPFDFNEFATACLKVEDGKLIDNVYLYAGYGEYEPHLYDMKLGIERYIELAYKAKCFNYWNLIYCAREDVYNYELMKRYWPKLFPQLTPDLEEFGISY